MSRKIADLLIKIGGDSYEFQQMASKVNKSVEGIGKSMGKLGKQMSLAFTLPLAAMGISAIKNIDIQAQAEAKLLRALDGRVDVQQRLIKQAGELQQRSTIGDEPFMEQQSYFAALKLTESQIMSATEAAMEMSYAFKDQGMTFETASKYIGQMYGGTVGRLGMLIPKLKEFSAEQLKSGDAVKYILDNYSGFAETAAREGLGFLEQLKNQWGDLLEDFGAIMFPLVQKIGGYLKSILTWLQNLSPEAKKIIVIVAGIATVAGPLLITMGGMAKLFPMIVSGLMSLVNPATIVVGLITAVAAAFAYAYMQKKQFLSEKAQEFIDTNNLTADSIDDVKAKNEELKRQIAQLKKDRTSEAGWLAGSVNGADVMTAGNVIGKVALLWKADDLKPYDDNIKALNEEVKLNNEVISLLDARKVTADPLQQIIQQLMDDLAKSNTKGEEATGILGDINREISALEKKKLLATTPEEVRAINKELEVLRERVLDINTEREPFVPVMPEGISIPMSPIKLDVSSLVPTGIDEKFIEARERYKEMVKQFQDDINAICANFTVDGFALIGEIIGSAIMGGLDTGGALAMLGNFFANFLQQVGTQMITFGVMASAMIKALQAFMANIWNIGGAIGMIVTGVALVAAAAGIKSLISKKAAKTAPKLAKGGLAFGPTYALIGDNKNAQIDPEVVAPLSKLKSMMGGSVQNIHITGELKARGGELSLVLDQNNTRIALIR